MVLRILYKAWSRDAPLSIDLHPRAWNRADRTARLPAPQSLTSTCKYNNKLGPKIMALSIGSAVERDCMPSCSDSVAVAVIFSPACRQLPHGQQLTHAIVCRPACVPLNVPEQVQHTCTEPTQLDAVAIV